MKRSEMKNIIWSSKYISGEYPEEMFEIITEDILCSIENAGMEPPGVKIELELNTFGKLINKIGFNIKSYQYNYDIINIWEKEE